MQKNAIEKEKKNVLFSLTFSRQTKKNEYHTKRKI